MTKFVTFLAKTYKIWIVVVAAVVFFLGYNAYLVDYSLLNLKVVLDKTGDIKTLDDARKLAEALDYSILTEVGASELQTATISRIELAKDILANIRNTDQIKDVKFLIDSVITKKEQKRSPVLTALDNVGKIFSPLGAKFSKAKLESQARYLEKYVGTLQDKNKLQEEYYKLANVYTKLANFAKAKQAFEKVVELDPDSALGKKSQFNLAWNEKYRGNLDEAIKQFDVLSKASDETLSGFSQYQVADSYKKKGEYEKAAGLFTQIAKKYPRQEFAQLAGFQAGYINLYDLSDFERAKKVFNEAKELFQGSDVVRQIESQTLGNIGAMYRKKGYGLLEEGQMLLLAEMYKRADEFFDKGLEILPRDAYSIMGKGLSYLWSGDPDKALSYGERAVTLAPKEAAISVNLGCIYIDLDMTDKAVKEFKRGLTYNRKYALLHYDLGYALSRAGKASEAIKEYRQAVILDPKFAYAYNNLGYNDWGLRKYANALDAFRKAVKLLPKFERAQYNLGMAYMIIGSYREAKKAFEGISAGSPLYGSAMANMKAIEKKLAPK